MEVFRLKWDSVTIDTPLMNESGALKTTQEEPACNQTGVGRYESWSIASSATRIRIKVRVMTLHHGSKPPERGHRGKNDMSSNSLSARVSVAETEEGCETNFEEKVCRNHDEHEGAATWNYQSWVAWWSGHLHVRNGQSDTVLQ